MSFFQKINQAIGFTQTESRVVLFLIFAFVVGIGIQLYKSTLNPIPPFNYSSLDSVFTVRSRLIDSIDVADSMNIGEQVSAVPAAMSVNNPVGTVNINIATKEELMQLPGIGDVMAERILLYREENGSFSSLEELKNIKGIGEKTFKRIVPYCTLGK